MKLLVTGGAGFIGSNFIRQYLANHPNDEVINFDVLTYAGNLENLRDVADDSRYTFIKGDIGDAPAVAKALPGVDVIVNFAAESHNDRAVLDPGIFVKTNVLGTQVLLEAARQTNIKRFHHISTDEVCGELGLDEYRAWTEEEPMEPRTPYSASKAAAEHLVMAYYHTYQLPVTISRCCNNYGPYQYPEKLISLFSTNALEEKSLPLFASHHFKREWIHVDDHNTAVTAIIEHGRVGELYNIGTGVELSVDEVANVILDELHKPQSLKTIVTDRPSHDRRYLLDSTKIRRELSWEPKIGFDEGIRLTIQWYRDHSEWWQPLKKI